MTGVVERNLSLLQILKGIQDKITLVFSVFRDEMMNCKWELRLVL